MYPAARVDRIARYVKALGLISAGLRPTRSINPERTGPLMSVLELHGQADRFNVRALQDINFTILCRGTSSFEARLLQLKGYQNQASKSYLEAKELDSSIDAVNERELHGVCSRPYLEVPGSENALSNATGVTLGALIRLDEPERARQGVITAWDSIAGRGIGIFVRDRMLMLLVGDGHVTMEISVAEPLIPGEWYEIAGSYDLTTGIGALTQRRCTSSVQLRGTDGRRSRTVTGHRRLGVLWPVPIMIGTSAKYTSRWMASEESFTGTIESPYLTAKATRATDLWGLHPRRLDAPALLAAWDFSQGLSADGLHSDEVPDLVGSFDARCVNAPLRAEPGHLGEKTSGFRMSPERYGAIRLRERRPDPERWKSKIKLVVPGTLEPGFYALRLRALDIEEYVPFAVTSSQTPSPDRP